MSKLEYFTIKPNLKQIYGKTITKDTKFTEKTEDGRVEQTCENLTLTTHIKSKEEVNGFVVEEESTVKVKMPEGTVLIWDEGAGFIIPQCQVCTLDELSEEIKDIDEIYNMKKEDE